jgi:hypothetical protein
MRRVIFSNFDPKTQSLTLSLSSEIVDMVIDMAYVCFCVLFLLGLEVFCSCFVWKCFVFVLFGNVLFGNVLLRKSY